MTYGTITISGIRNVYDKRKHFFQSKRSMESRVSCKKGYIIKVLPIFQIVVTFEFISYAVLHTQSLMIL